MHLNPWHILVVAMAGWMNRQQSAVVEYLQEENRVLRELLGDKRLCLNDEQRRRLAAKGKALGRRLLSDMLLHRDARHDLTVAPEAHRHEIRRQRQSGSW